MSVSSYTPSKVLRILASAEENSVVEYCGGRSIIEQIITYPEETSSGRCAFLVLFKDATSALAALQRPQLTGLGGRPVIINTVADSSTILNRFKNRFITTVNQSKGHHITLAPAISAHIMPVLEKENCAEVSKASLKLLQSQTREARASQPFSSTYSPREKNCANISISSEVALSPTFRRSQFSNSNATKVRQAPSKPSLKPSFRINTLNLSPAHPSATDFSYSAGTPSKYALPSTGRRCTLDSSCSGFSGSNIDIACAERTRSRPRKTSIFGSNAVRFEETPAAVKPSRQETSNQSQTVMSSPVSLDSAKKARVMVELAEAKKKYFDSLLALKAKLLEIEKNELERNAITSVKIYSVEA